PAAPAYGPAAPGYGTVAPAAGSGGWPYGGRPAVPPPPREAWHRPRRLDPVPGTPFGVLQLDVPPVTSGLAVGALVAGVASILLSLVVVCFGLAGAGAGWGPWAAGAFALLAVLVGGAGVVLGVLARRQIGRAKPPPAVRFTGKGPALAGLICAAVGLAGTLGAVALAVLLQLA
ncbi:MAG TPA: phage holin family protein, partial [Micromonosporaceae bacterium]|nr:phage holin family protein [Micromonosporaceae bacterium]